MARDSTRPDAAPKRSRRRIGLAALIVLGATVLLLLFVVPTNNHPPAYYNELAAVATLRSLVAAEYTFQADEQRDVDNDGTYDFGTLADLAKPGPDGQPYIDAETATGTKRGYTFALTTTPSNNAEPTFTILATPTDPANSGTRAFFTSQHATIHHEPAGITPTQNSPEID